jgi:hypothetical protein
LADYFHFGRAIRARQLKHVIENPTVVDELRFDVRLTHIPFARLEAIRVSLAKHEVRRGMDSVALMPTQGPINSWCGSLDFELENGRYTMGFISRTDAKWLASAIHGDPKRDSGILNNPLYIGRLVWNRR